MSIYYIEPAMGAAEIFLGGGGGETPNMEKKATQQVKK